MSTVAAQIRDYEALQDGALQLSAELDEFIRVTPDHGGTLRDLEFLADRFAFTEAQLARLREERDRA